MMMPGSRNEIGIRCQGESTEQKEEAVSAWIHGSPIQANEGKKTEPFFPLAASTAWMPFHVGLNVAWYPHRHRLQGWYLTGLVVPLSRRPARLDAETGRRASRGGPTRLFSVGPFVRSDWFAPHWRPF